MSIGMKNLLLLIATISLMPMAFAAELSDSDAGTYEVLKEDRTPSGVFYRFTRSSNKWVVYGKLPGKDWKDRFLRSWLRLQKQYQKRDSSLTSPQTGGKAMRSPAYRILLMRFADSRLSTLPAKEVTYSLRW